MNYPLQTTSRMVTYLLLFSAAVNVALAIGFFVLVAHNNAVSVATHNSAVATCKKSNATRIQTGRIINGILALLPADTPSERQQITQLKTDAAANYRLSNCAKINSVG